MVEQRPFTLQGAVVEALVERGRLHFVHGNIKEVANERVFENLDTKTAAFRELFNIFPYGGRYYVNHAPGQFLLAAPWYAVCVHLGWRFATDAASGVENLGLELNRATGRARSHGAVCPGSALGHSMADSGFCEHDVCLSESVVGCLWSALS